MQLHLCDTLGHDQCLLPETALGLVLTSVYSSGMGLLNSKNVLSVSVRTAFQDAILYFFFFLFFLQNGPRKRDDGNICWCYHSHLYCIDIAQSALQTPFRNVSFPHEAIRGLDFFSAQVDAFLYITSGRRPRVMEKCINEC